MWYMINHLEQDVDMTIICWHQPLLLECILLKFWCVIQNLIPHVLQMVLATMFLLRYGLLTLIRITSLIDLARYCSSPHNAEVFNSYVINLWWYNSCIWDHKVFFKPFIKCSFRFSNVLCFTVHPSTLISIDDPTSLKDGVLVLSYY